MSYQFDLHRHLCWKRDASGRIVSKQPVQVTGTKCLFFHEQDAHSLCAGPKLNHPTPFPLLVLS